MCSVPSDKVPGCNLRTAWGVFRVKPTEKGETLEPCNIVSDDRDDAWKRGCDLASWHPDERYVLNETTVWVH